MSIISVEGAPLFDGTKGEANQSLYSICLMLTESFREA